jgi:hypothetical protein
MSYHLPMRCNWVYIPLSRRLPAQERRGAATATPSLPKWRPLWVISWLTRRL